MTYSPKASSAFNDTWNRSTFISPQSGMCSFCTEECSGTCEIALAAVLGYKNDGAFSYINMKYIKEIKNNGDTTIVILSNGFEIHCLSTILVLVSPISKLYMPTCSAYPHSQF